MSRKSQYSTSVKPANLAKSTPKTNGSKKGHSFRRTILPPLAGILATAAVLAAFNAQIIEAQIRYHFADRPTISTVASTTPGAPAVTEEDTKSPSSVTGPLLTIPAIGAEAPIVFEPSFAEWKVQVALRSGVVHYGTTASPGQNGNVVILGHSSGQAWAPGDYKFVFTLLNKLQKDDLIYLDYNGTRYIYKVTTSVVVPPTDTSQIQPTATPTLSLVTCTPVGTSTNRLIVHADQVSPSPTKTTPTAVDPTMSDPVPVIPTKLPGNDHVSPWQRFLNLF